jgi:hypothetical protein
MDKWYMTNCNWYGKNFRWNNAEICLEKLKKFKKNIGIHAEIRIGHLLHEGQKRYRVKTSSSVIKLVFVEVIS